MMRLSSRVMGASLPNFEGKPYASRPFQTVTLPLDNSRKINRCRAGQGNFPCYNPPASEGR
jgi:hypothetical protein